MLDKINPSIVIGAEMIRTEDVTWDCSWFFRSNEARIFYDRRNLTVREDKFVTL